MQGFGKGLTKPRLSFLAILLASTCLSVAPGRVAAAAECLRGDCVNGFGVAVLPGKETCACWWKNGLRHGRGSCTWPNGDVFAGEFRDDAMFGQGAFTLPDGERYTGGVQDSAMHGQGTLVHPDGRRHRGGFAHDRRNGLGVQSWPDGRTERGFWKDDVLQAPLSEEEYARAGGGAGLPRE